MFGKLIGYRATQEQIVDERVRLLTEVIGHIRSVKLYAYEKIFSERVIKLRGAELSKLKRFGFVRAMIMSTFNFLPILAAVGESVCSCHAIHYYLQGRSAMAKSHTVTFVVYGITGHTLDAAVIFTGLQFFNVLKTPISQLPMIVTALLDAVVGLSECLF